MLTRIEDNLVACAVPRLDALDALHDGRLSIQEDHSALSKDNDVSALAAQSTEAQSAQRRAIAVVPQIVEWPAMPLEKDERPTSAPMANQRARLRTMATELSQGGSVDNGGHPVGHLSEHCGVR